MAVRQRGWSVIESLVGTAVASVLASVAVPNMVEVKNGMSVSGATMEIVSALHLARSEAVTRHTRVAVSAKAGADWRSGWVVYVDADDNGRFDTSRDELIRAFAPLDPSMQVVPNFGATNNGATLSYTPQGVIRRPGSQGLVLGSLELRQGGHVKTICVATARIRTVDRAKCS